MYSSLFNHTKRIPLLNVVLFPAVIIIDNIPQPKNKLNVLGTRNRWGVKR